MNFITRKVTAAALLLHLSLGCCWHHAHGCAAHGDEEAAACCSSQEIAGCLHSTDRDDDDHDTDERPCGKSEPCKEARCQFLSLPRMASGAAHSADAAAIGAAELSPVVGQRAANRPSAPVSPRPAANQRCQILLI